VDDAALEAAIAKVAEASLGGLTRAVSATVWASTSRSISPARPMATSAAAEGDFFPWERTDLVDALKDAAAFRRKWWPDSPFLTFERACRGRALFVSGALFESGLT
jgi:hypothetical protein